MNYYNDNDPYVADWLRNLIAAGELPAGDVDDRSITEVQPNDIRGYRQVHLFAGIGGWPLALEWGGWPADRPVWSASAPCPPFSVAGKSKHCPSCQSEVLIWHPGRTGFAVCVECAHQWEADERHLWPEVWRLAAELRPPAIIGEQVAGRGGLDWWSAVRGSLAILGYVAGAASLPAAAVAAPHRRERLFWAARIDRLANPACGRSEPAQRRGTEGQEAGFKAVPKQASTRGQHSRVDDAEGARGFTGSTLPKDQASEELGRPSAASRGTYACGERGEFKPASNGGGVGRMAYADDAERGRAEHSNEYGEKRRAIPAEREALAATPRERGETCDGVGNSASAGLQGCRQFQGQARKGEVGAPSETGGVGDPQSDGRRQGSTDAGGSNPRSGASGGEQRPGNGGGACIPGWGDLIFIPCVDDRARPTKPGLFPLAYGVPSHLVLTCADCETQSVADENVRVLRQGAGNAIFEPEGEVPAYCPICDEVTQHNYTEEGGGGRVGMLRAYGNAIVPQLGAEFVAAYLAAEEEVSYDA